MLDRKEVTLRQIGYFIALMEQGGFRKAADRLGITQPTLTAQIAVMEKALDIILFERSRTGVKPTPAARDLLPNARRVEEEVQGFTDAAAGFGGFGGGTYRMGVTPTLGPYLLPYVLPEMHRKHQTLKLYVREDAPSDLQQELRSGGFDLILSTQPIAGGDLDVEHLFREPLKLVLPSDHRLANKPRIDRSDLFGEEVLTIDEHHLFHRQISELCEDLGATVRRDYEGTSLDTVRQMVVMGMGIAFLPALYVISEIRESTSLRVTDVQGIKVDRQHAMAWRSRSPLRGMFRMLAEEIKAMVYKRLRQHVLMA